MISLAKIKSYILRLIGCIAVVAIICGICYALRTAIVDYDPVEISMNAKIPQEQNVKIYYTTSMHEDFSKTRMQECHLNRTEQQEQILCTILKVPAIHKIKFEFAQNADKTVIGDLTVASGEESAKLNDASSFRFENTASESASSSQISFSSEKLNPSVEYFGKINISSDGHVWFFPVNVYTCSIAALIVFAGFWWLLSVISVINSDIESSLVKKESN